MKYTDKWLFKNEKRIIEEYRDSIETLDDVPDIVIQSFWEIDEVEEC